MQLLFLFAVAWCLFWGFMATRSRGFLLLMAMWGVLHWVLATRGVYGDATATPPPQALFLAPVVLALLVALILPAGRRWLHSLDLLALTALHILRIPVELVLHQAWARGLVPRDMTYSGHNFDILSGISAACLVAWLLSKRPPSRGVLIAWNVVCLGLLLNVVVTAVLSIPSVLQRLNFDQPNVLVTRTPFVLLPAILVPAVLWSHVAALFKLTSGAGRPARPRP